MKPRRPELEIATSAGDIDADWLARALQRRVRSVKVEAIGTGQTSSTARLSIEGDDCPDTVIAKWASGDLESRRRLVTAHRSEVGFYRNLAPTLGVRVPRCWYAAVSDDGCGFTLLLEDLAPYEPGRQIDGCSLGHATAAVRNLARLHASRWNDESLRDVEFIVALTEDRAAMLAEMGRQATEQFIARYEGSLDGEDVVTLHDSADALFDFLTGHPDPYAVIHGDYRLDNLLLDPVGHDVVAVDWQTLTAAFPARDLAYFVSMSFTTEQRRAEEDGLVQAYWTELQAGGVRGYPLDRCISDYRLGHLHGPMITTLGSLTSTGARDHDGDEMFLSMAQRSCAAVRDHQSIALA